jgi:hypothetical protein
MNWLDLILGAGFMLFAVGGLVLAILAFADSEAEAGITILFLGLGLGFLCGAPLVTIDKGAGSTIGEITSVDKSFWGNTKIFVKTSETEQEEYCAEDADVAAKATELIGKKVKISYGERVGIFSTGKCGQAPVEVIEVVE